MTDTNPPTTVEELRAAQVAHATEVVSKFQEIVDLIEGRSELWFGGLPPSFVNVRNMMTAQKRTVQTDFGLTEATPEG